MLFRHEVKNDAFIFQLHPGGVNPYTALNMTKHTTRKRTVNFKSDVTRGRTVGLESRLLAELADSPDGLTMREIGDELGIGRVDATYHCKRLAASGELRLELEPCDDNSGIRLRAWDVSLHAAKVRARFSEIPSGPRALESGIAELAPTSRRRAS